MSAVLLVVALIGILVGVVTGFYILYLAFRTSVWWGLACLFIPFASLAFVFVHWDDAGKPWLIGVAGMLVGLGASALAGPTPGGGGLGAFSGGGGSDSEITRVLKNNLRTTKTACESYAVDKGGEYPTSVSDPVFRSYFPGGDNGKGKVEGTPPTNPVTNQPQWPVPGHIKDVKEARGESLAEVEAGAIEYSPVYDTNHRAYSYALRAGDRTGHGLVGSTGVGTYVESNQ